MSLKGVIRIGDTTTHGGVVLEGFPTMNVMGKLAAGLGHKVSCPKCSGEHVIAEGVTGFMNHGTLVAVDGMFTTCGAQLIASQHSLRAVHTGGSLPDGKTGSKFLIKDSETGQPLPNRTFIARVGGTEIEGTTAQNGYAHVDANANEMIQIHVPFKAPTQLIKG